MSATETVPLGYAPPPMNRPTLWRRIPTIVAPASFVEAITISLAALLLSMVVFGIFVTLSGANPFDVYALIYRGAFGNWFSWQNTLIRAAPLMLTALCVALPARVGMIIIGGEGALVIGGLIAAGTAHLFAGHSPWVVFMAMLIAGTLSGGLWVTFAGALRLYRGVNETISSLLLTYIAIALLNHLCEGPWHDPLSLNNPSTWEIGAKNTLGVIGSSDIHWGLVYGIIACIGSFFLMDHTVFGFSARIIGGNSRAAKLIGLSIGKISLLACFLGGSAAALAGVVEVAAVQGKANAALVAGYGYQGILVAFLARQNPLAIIPVAILLGGIAASGGQLQKHANLPDAAVIVLQGIIFLMILGFETFYGRLKIFQPKGVGAWLMYLSSKALGWVSLPGALRVSTPFLFVSLGETITEKSGRVNLGQEGSLVMGAMSAYAISYLASQKLGMSMTPLAPWLGVLAAGACGLLLGALHAFLCSKPRVNDVAVGIAMMLFGTGLAFYLGKPFIQPRAPQLPSIPLGFWSHSAPVKSALNINVLFFIGAALAPITLWAMNNTRWGLKLRTVGESADAARAMGYSINGVRMSATALGGFFAGIGGAFLSLSYPGVWNEGLSSGQGLMAVALVIFARWNPVNCLFAALLFGGASALGPSLQSVGVTSGYYLYSAAPYVLTLLIMIITCSPSRSLAGVPGELSMTT